MHAKVAMKKVNCSKKCYSEEQKCRGTTRKHEKRIVVVVHREKEATSLLYKKVATDGQ
jgi:hypothetical protein